MFKTTIAAAAAAVAFAPAAALAGPYVNVEANAGPGLEIITPPPRQISTLAMREKLAPLPTTSRLVLPIVAVDGVDTETQFSGKAGLGIPVSDERWSLW